MNHPQYKHLFKGIGKFNVTPVSITLKDDAQLVQKPPRKVPLAMKRPFKEELDRMEKAGIISKYDSTSGPAPEWLNSFVSEETKWISSYLLRPNRSQQAYSLTCM